MELIGRLTDRVKGLSLLGLPIGLMKTGNIVPQSQPIHFPTSRLHSIVHVNRCSQLLLSCKFLNALLCESSFEGADSQTDGQRHNCSTQRGTHVQIGRTTTAATLSCNLQH